MYGAECAQETLPIALFIALKICL